MKRIMLIISLFLMMVVLICCSNNAIINEKNNDNEQPVVQEEPNNEQSNNNEEENNIPENKEPGSLYICYVFNYEKPDVISKVTSIESYDFLSPKREGYEFFGWYKDSDLTEALRLSDLVMPTDEKDIIIYAYADWTIASYIVQFVCDGEVILSRNVGYGQACREPNATFKPGYRFVGWDKDCSSVKSDMVINAVYEKIDASKNIMVVLGNWMNNDGTISATMRTRLELALKAYSEFAIDYIVVSGGMANSVAGISEAEAMYNYLVAHGIDGNIIIKEDQSMSTQQNATYTMKKLENIDFNNLIIVSTIEHFVNYQTIKFFNDAANNNAKIRNKNINIMIYTNNGSY